MGDDYKPSEDSLADTQIDPMPRLGDSSVPGKARPASEEGTGPQVRYFGVYELEQEIARGGMGVVYKARQRTLNRTVAVKVILSGQLASETEVKRFLIEAEAAANLNHPGVVPVYEFGEFENTHYFSMAFVDGPSLAAKLSEQALETDEAVELLVKITEAVAYAHSQGVIHRDLKPGNILLEKGVTPRIADFGLAKRIGDDAELTLSGTVMGSAFYMPPEQARGNIEKIGPASDIYALGAILYKMLTGRPPFQAATAYDTLQQVLNEEPVRLRQLNPAIPVDLETICLKCLEKDIERRYRSANELVEELRRFQDGVPILARPIGQSERLWRWCRRNPLPAGLGSGLALVIMVGVFTAATFWSQARAEKQRTQDQQRMVQVLSDMVLEKTLDETNEWLRLFFQPVEQELLVARDWGRTGYLVKDDPQALNNLLVPLIEHYPQISSLMVGDGRGREHMLLCIETTEGESRTQEWRSRITRRDEWGDRVQWIRWGDDYPEVQKTEELLPDYDPRLRPWYQGAVETPANASTAIHWTAPYVFFTTKDLGITASVRYDQGDGLERVVAYDVLLQDITAYTTEKHPTEHGKVAVLTENLELIGLPQADFLAGQEDWKKAFLKKPTELGLDVVADAAALFSFDEDEITRVKQFESDGQTWWAGVEPFQLGESRRLWILVIIPEKDLRRDLASESTEVKSAGL